MRVRLVLLVAMLSACSTSARSASSRTNSRPPPEVAPTPYTADDIRDASHVGRTYVFRVERAGQPPMFHAITFTAVTPESAELRSETRDEHGAVTEAPSISRAAWDELRRHAEFPREATTVTRTSVTVPAGTFDCTVYTVRGDHNETSRFYFARDRPGPPVLFYVEHAGARVVTNTLVEYRDGGN